MVNLSEARLVSLWDSMGLIQDQKVGTVVLSRAEVGTCMVFRLSPGRGVTRPEQRSCHCYQFRSQALRESSFLYRKRSLLWSPRVLF